MLQALRAGTQTWVAAIFIFLLAGSFAVWGIADIFGGIGYADVAVVGKKGISQIEYRRAYNQEMQRLNQQFGRVLQRDQARLLGIDRQVIGRLVGTATLDLQAQNLNLGISDDAVAARITRDPAFQSLSGKFDARRFQATLRQVGFTEAGFVERQRRGLLREHITNTLTSEVGTPKTLVEAIHRFRNEERTLDYFLISPEAVGEVQEPDEAALKTYYDENKGPFTAPPYRKVELIKLRPDEYRSKVVITDEAVRKEYEDRTSDFNSPETRRVEQITFPDGAAAKQAHEELKGGKSFSDLADQVGREDRFIDYGSVSIGGIIDKTIAKAAFALKDATFSEPIFGTLSTAIIRVSEIKPSSSKTLDEVKDQIKEKLVAEGAVNRVADLFDKIEEDQTKGLSFEDIAGKRSIKVHEIAAVDSYGKSPDGSTPPNLPSNNRLLAAIFAADVDVQNEPVELSQDSFAFFNVVAIIPEKLKPFGSVKDDVKKEWIAAQTRAAVYKLAKELVARLETGGDIKAVAQSKNQTAKTSEPLKRSARTDDLPVAAIAQAFALREGRAGSTEIDGGIRRVIFKVSKVKLPAAPTDTERAALTSTVTPQIGQELIGQYLVDLQRQQDVTINQQAIEQATQAGGLAGGGRGGF